MVSQRSVVERIRVVVSRLAFLGAVALALLSQSWWNLGEITEETMFCGALILTLIGCLGRIWCLAHISGRKNQDLIMVGPYSICRNPLYLFSFIGMLGVTLTTCTLAIPALAIFCFAIYYPFVIAAEERRLEKIHGAAYREYCQRVPQFIPSFRNYLATTHSTIDVRLFNRGLQDVAWFVLALALAHLNVELHEAGYGITLFKLV